jgi:hypothetical protein
VGAVEGAGRHDELRVLEESLWREETRFDVSHMERLLAPDFVEVGRSGRMHDRAAILALARGPIDVRLPLPGFSVRPLGAGAVLVTYETRTRAGADAALRASVWALSDGGWKLRYHQGTPAAG